jgi:hypothetical protein
MNVLGIGHAHALRLAQPWLAAIAALTAACAAVPTATSEPPIRPKAGPELRWEQFGFAEEASFHACIRPTCPQASPKTFSGKAPSTQRQGEQQTVAPRTTHDLQEN